MINVSSREHSIVRLHSRDENCWGVINERGALVGKEKLAMKLTCLQAETLAKQLNEAAADGTGPIPAVLERAQTAT